MGATVTRNSLKGYTYQQYVYLLFVAIMDADRKINKINVEIIADHNFDDIEIELNNGTKYLLQIKNNENASSNNIKVDGAFILNNDFKIALPQNGQNSILVIKSEETKLCKSKEFGLPVMKLCENVCVLPLTTNVIEETLSTIYADEKRQLVIRKFVDSRISNGFFSVTVKDLPDFELFSTKLSEELVSIGIKMETKNKLLWCVGKPGIGKSYLAAELEKTHQDMILYRFWTHALDENITLRLQFSEFIKDIGCKFLNTLKRYSEEEIIAQIINSKKLFVIDGLDHVYNYAPKEFDKFIEFIKKIDNSNTIVMTRPIKGQDFKNKISLSNWSWEQSREFLVKKYNFEYTVFNQIFKIAKGYPIITKFLAEQYLKEKSLNITTEIETINDYYKEIIKHTNIKVALSLFLITTSYLTYDEIREFLDDFACDMMLSFVNDYPYLFEIEGNRISLIHDSFNTYIKNQKVNYKELSNKVIEIVKNSLMNNNVEFMSRFLTFSLPYVDKMKIYNYYADFQVFTKTLSTNYDFESVKEFYVAMQQDIKNYSNLFDIYKYYSFILICQIVERNDFVGLETLIKSHVEYLYRIGIRSKDIYSTGLFWRGFLAYESKDINKYQEWFKTSLYGDCNIDDIKYDYEKEDEFFDCIKNVYSFSETLNRIKEKYKENVVHYDVALFEISGLLVNIYKFGCPEKNLQKNLHQYVINEDQYSKKYILDFFSQFIQDDYIIKQILRSFTVRLKQVGITVSQNMYLGDNLKQLLHSNLHEGMNSTAEEVKSFLRLKNFLNEEVNISEIWKIYFMHRNHKDYSVVNLPKALIIYEKFNFIKETKSIKILALTMDQSERGVKHLLNDYTNMKDDKFVHRMQYNVDFMDCRYLNIFELGPEKINCFTGDFVEKQFGDIIGRLWRSKIIEFKKIENLLCSNYAALVVEILTACKFKIINAPKNKAALLRKLNLEFETQVNETISRSKPLENGYIYEEDIPYIREQKISISEISNLTYGLYSCLPFVEAFSHFNKFTIQNELLNIIHESMYAKLHMSSQIGNWYNYLGNIPDLVCLCEYPVDWSKMFAIFEEFLICSGVEIYEDN